MRPMHISAKGRSWAINCSHGHWLRLEQALDQTWSITANGLSTECLVDAIAKLQTIAETAVVQLTLRQAQDEAWSCRNDVDNAKKRLADAMEKASAPEPHPHRASWVDAVDRERATVTSLQQRATKATRHAARLAFKAKKAGVTPWPW